MTDRRSINESMVPVRDEYTPAQRRAIDTRLAAARKGPYYGPFDTADEAINFLRKGAEETNL
jgi:hypothetical protein